MSITYEEALATLHNMFGEKWSREYLDAVLRHQKGHMENTCDLILQHGDRDPKVLIDKLNAGVDPNAHTIDADEELARQLASSAGRPISGARPPPQQQLTTSRQGCRGIPTTLPDGFLRIPNHATSTNSDQMASDEALARMLQDKMFTEELSRNPDFAHLARGRQIHPQQRTAAAASSQRTTTTQYPPPDIDIMKSLGELGKSARSRLQMLATQFQKGRGGAGGNAAAGATPTAGSKAERRGLLEEGGEEEDVAFEFATRKDL